MSTTTEPGNEDKGMPVLHDAQVYPPSIRIVLTSMPPIATQIANRWMHHWPERTWRLIEAGEYLAALALEVAWTQEVFGPTPPADGADTTNVIQLSMRRPPPRPRSR